MYSPIDANELAYQFSAVHLCRMVHALTLTTYSTKCIYLCYKESDTQPASCTTRTLNSQHSDVMTKGQGDNGPLNYSLSKKFLVGKFSVNNTNLGLEIPHFGGNLSIHNSSVGNLQLSVGKLQLPATPVLPGNHSNYLPPPSTGTFLTHDAAESSDSQRECQHVNS